MSPIVAAVEVEPQTVMGHYTITVYTPKTDKIECKIFNAHYEVKPWTYREKNIAIARYKKYRA